MPSLDVSEVLLSPEFASRVRVIRRNETIDANGRATSTPTIFDGVVAVITTSPPGNSDNRDDAQMMPRSIKIRTIFRLRGVGPGINPDLVVADGITYTVNSILPWTKFGRGFTSATAISSHATDPPAT